MDYLSHKDFLNSIKYHKYPMQKLMAKYSLSESELEEHQKRFIKMLIPIINLTLNNEI